jgi:hypothetical protein
MGEYCYFIKQLGRQELGSVDSSDKPQRGRYVLVSKDENVLSLFPPLSENVVNDTSLLPILPLYTGIKTYANFVYHNDKHSRPNVGTRDEYRLYLNKYLDSKTALFYKSGDFIVLRKVSNNEDGNDESFWALDYIEQTDEIFAMFVKTLSPVHHNSGQFFYKGIIEEFEERLKKVNENAAITMIDNTITNEIQKEQQNGKDVESLFNSQSFRDFVLTGYGFKCAVTNQNICFKTLYNIEAAHIRPKSHNGTFMPSNGMPLCRDMHWAFDKGFFTITADYTVKVHPDVQSDLLAQYDGKKINLPKDAFFIPSKENLQYHNENIYGLFKTTGRL